MGHSSFVVKKTQEKINFQFFKIVKIFDFFFTSLNEYLNKQTNELLCYVILLWNKINIFNHFNFKKKGDLRMLKTDNHSLS